MQNMEVGDVFRNLVTGKYITLTAVESTHSKPCFTSRPVLIAVVSVDLNMNS